MADGSHKILVGLKKNILNVKSSFEIITTDHVFSVQKNVSDETLKLALYAADSTLSGDKGRKPG